MYCGTCFPDLEYCPEFIIPFKEIETAKMNVLSDGILGIGAKG